MITVAIPHHCRSYPSSIVYPNPHTLRATQYVAEELPKAQQRIAEWSRGRR